MIYGITGNTQKQKLWEPVTELAKWFMEKSVPFLLQGDIADGLSGRGLLPHDACRKYRSDSLAADADVILSFGGDGTMLLSAHEVGTHETPILGVNIGRLGFLAEIEVGQLHATIRSLENGDYRIEPRMLLSADVREGSETASYWALNEFVIERSGSAGLLSIRVKIDGIHLNDYWADGLIISTPTGSTAYSMSVGGPIVAPGAEVVILTPLAPHSLTVRPIVLPATAIIEANVPRSEQPYVLAYDGRSRAFEPGDDPITFRFSKAAHAVNLIKLPEQHYFQTLRTKLMWGVLRHG